MEVTARFGMLVLMMAGALRANDALPALLTTLAQQSEAGRPEGGGAQRPLVFVITGESNSGGIGSNADASPNELMPRACVQIMNLTDGKFGFEDLQLGVNNLRDHHRLQDFYDNSHGFENGLAGAVEAGLFRGHKHVYLIKTGHGGSRISQWSEQNPSGFWKKFVQRIEAGKKQLPEKPQWVVWFSLGINDAIDGADVPLWKKNTRAHLKRIKAQLPGAIVVMTQFQSMKKYPEFDKAIEEIASASADVFAVDSTGATLRDANHWDYAGLKTVATRMVEVTRKAITIVERSSAQDASERNSSGNEFPWVTSQVRAPRLLYRNFESNVAKSKVSYHVYTPESYDTENERRFPVLYWLHGTVGGTRGLPALVRHFNSAIRTKKIQPMLVVFPHGPMSMWCDSKDGHVPMETMIVKELLPQIDAGFRTVASRAGRMIEGHSMGGYGAARLGFKYPEIFGAVSIQSGGPLQAEFTTAPRVSDRARRQVLQKVYGGDMEYFKAESPWTLSDKNADRIRGKVHIRQIIGQRDVMLDINRKFDAHLTRLRIPHAYQELPRVDHNPRAIFNALGDGNWKFYRTAFAPNESKHSTEEGE